MLHFGFKLGTDRLQDFLITMQVCEDLAGKYENVLFVAGDFALFQK